MAKHSTVDFRFAGNKSPARIIITPSVLRVFLDEFTGRVGFCRERLFAFFAQARVQVLPNLVFTPKAFVAFHTQ